MQIITASDTVFAVDGNFLRDPQAESLPNGAARRRGNKVASFVTVTMRVPFFRDQTHTTRKTD